MTSDQAPGAGNPTESPVEEAGGVSGMVNLTINLPDNIRISTVDSDGEETTVSNGNTTGMIQIYAGSAAPAGWLLCNGAAVSRATYADLFDVIGTRYGVGNANTTFNLPDLRGRFPLGKDDMGEVSADRVTAAEADTIGGASGLEDHTLVENETPVHTHAVARTDQIQGRNNQRWAFRTSDGVLRPSIEYDLWFGPDSDRVVGRGGDSNWSPIIDYGGGQAHNNMPPYQTVNYIIKT